jgi:hypothetical protein
LVAYSWTVSPLHKFTFDSLSKTLGIRALTFVADFITGLQEVNITAKGSPFKLRRCARI